MDQLEQLELIKYAANLPQEEYAELIVALKTIWDHAHPHEVEEMSMPLDKALTIINTHSQGYKNAKQSVDGTDSSLE